MFMDITHYKPKRKGKRGPIPLEGAREPAGRLSRAAEGTECMVYFVTLDGGRRIKVGRTQNFKERIKNYRHAGGAEVYCLAQLVVGSVADSILLEREAIRYLQARYERVGREWFDIPYSQLATAISEIVSASGVASEMRGAPGAEREVTEWQETVARLSLAATQHKRG